MKRVVNGMHLPNQGMWHIEQMLRAVGDTGAVTLLHFLMFPHDVISDNSGDVENDYWYGKLRWGWPAQGIPPAPERLIHVRLYQANWADWDPKEIARRVVPLLSAWRSADGTRSADLWMDPFVCISPCNEQNLEGPDHLKHDYVRHANWQIAFWDEIDRLKPERKALSCLGAWAFGHDVTPDVPDSEYMVPEVRKLCQRVDIIATHPYANFTFPGGGWDTADREKAGYYYLLRDFRPEGWRDAREPGKPHDPGGILAQIPNKPLLITESGTFTHGDVGRNAENIAAMRTLLAVAANSGRCLGVTWFIWNSGPEHAGNRIWYNEGLRNALEAMDKFETTATVPKRGQTPMPNEDRLSTLLRSTFGSAFEDLRDTLVQNPGGPNGAFGALHPASVQGIVLHHTAAAASTTWATIADWHVNGRKFAGIGYHLGIRAGKLAYLGQIGTARAHVAGQNDKYVGVVVAGNYETAQPEDADVKLLIRLRTALNTYFGRDVPWKGHRQVAQTACPGTNLQRIVDTVLAGTPTGPDALVAALNKWADNAQVIQPNPNAALYKAIKTDGFFLLSDESGARGVVPKVEGYNVVAQLARSMTTGEERVYWWDGTGVRWIKRGA